MERRGANKQLSFGAYNYNEAFVRAKTSSIFFFRSAFNSPDQHCFDNAMLVFASFPTGKYANLEQVYSALTERQVQAILVDAFTVGSRKDLFEARRDLYVNKILDFSAAYGVVLAGEGNKLHKCFQSYINEQRSEVSQIISDNVQRIEVSGVVWRPQTQ